MIHENCGGKVEVDVTCQPLTYRCQKCGDCSETPLNTTTYVKLPIKWKGNKK